jgi:hypothetical protein
VVAVLVAALAVHLHPGVLPFAAAAALWFAFGREAGTGNASGGRVLAVLVPLAAILSLSIGNRHSGGVVGYNALHAHLLVRLLEDPFDLARTVLLQDVLVGACGVLVVAAAGFRARMLPPRVRHLGALAVFATAVAMVIVMTPSYRGDLPARGAYLMAALPVAAWVLFPRELHARWRLPLAAIVLNVLGAAWWMSDTGFDHSQWSTATDRAVRLVRARGGKEPIIAFASPQQQGVCAMNCAERHSPYELWHVGSLRADGERAEWMAGVLDGMAVVTRGETPLLLAPNALPMLERFGAGSLAARIRAGFTLETLLETEEGPFLLVRRRPGSDAPK